MNVSRKRREPMVVERDKNKPKEERRYFFAYRDENGKQCSEFCGHGTEGEKEAESRDLHLKADRKVGKRPAALSGMHFGDLFKAYLNDRKMNGASKSYTDELKSWFNNALRRMSFLDKPVDKLSYADMLKIAEHYQGRTQATRNRYFGYLRAVFRFGIKKNLTRNNPLFTWSRPGEEPRRSRLTIEDLALIKECAPCHLQWALEVEFALGTRPGPTELLSLKWENVNFKENYIEVYARKTKRWREIPISPEFRERLKAKKVHAKSGYIIEYRGSRVNKFQRSFRTARESAGIDYPCEMYDVRHLFARTLLNKGADLAAVSRLMGHASVKMTADVYYNVQEQEKRRAIDLLPSLNSVLDGGANSPMMTKMMTNLP
jgi:integrase